MSKSDARQRMLDGAIDLMRRRGLVATSLRDVVSHVDAPRGSIAHYFPEGKKQLFREALLHAGAQIQNSLQKLMQKHGALQGMRLFIDNWKKTLKESNYEAGCPVLAVAVEDNADSGSKQSLELLELAAEIFASSQDIMAEALTRDGIGPKKAQSLAMLVMASVEGAIALCRAACSTQPLETVWAELGELLSAELNKNMKQGPSTQV